MRPVPLPRGWGGPCLRRACPCPVVDGERDGRRAAGAAGGIARGAFARSGSGCRRGRQWWRASADGTASACAGRRGRACGGTGGGASCGVRAPAGRGGPLARDAAQQAKPRPGGPRPSTRRQAPSVRQRWARLPPRPTTGAMTWRRTTRPTIHAAPASPLQAPSGRRRARQATGELDGTTGAPGFPGRWPPRRVLPAARGAPVQLGPGQAVPGQALPGQLPPRRASPRGQPPGRSGQPVPARPTRQGARPPGRPVPGQAVPRRACPNRAPRPGPPAAGPPHQAVPARPRRPVRWPRGIRRPAGGVPEAARPPGHPATRAERPAAAPTRPPAAAAAAQQAWPAAPPGPRLRAPRYIRRRSGGSPGRARPTARRTPASRRPRPPGAASCRTAAPRRGRPALDPNSTQGRAFSVRTLGQGVPFGRRMTDAQQPRQSRSAAPTPQPLPQAQAQAPAKPRRRRAPLRSPRPPRLPRTRPTAAGGAVSSAPAPSPSEVAEAPSSRRRRPARTPRPVDRSRGWPMPPRAPAGRTP